MSRQLGQILIGAKVIQPEQLEQALKLQGPIPQPLGQLLVSQGLATEEQIAAALATQLGIPYVRLASAVVEPKALDWFPTPWPRSTRSAPSPWKSGGCSW